MEKIINTIPQVYFENGIYQSFFLDTKEYLSQNLLKEDKTDTKFESQRIIVELLKNWLIKGGAKLNKIDIFISSENERGLKLVENCSVNLIL